MLITRRSMFSGKIRTLSVNITKEQLDHWKNGGLIQNVMRNLTDDEREFVISGVTKEEWDAEYEEKTPPYKQGHDDKETPSCS